MTDPMGPQSAPLPPSAPVGAAPGVQPHGISGMANDAATLAATGLIVAVLFAVVAGIFGVLTDPGAGAGVRARLLNLTDTVDVGDVALLGIAVALLLLTPDPPGGLGRPLLLQITSALAVVITGYGVIRALVLISDEGPGLARAGGFVATVGVAIAAATIAFYAATESFLKAKRHRAASA